MWVAREWTEVGVHRAILDCDTWERFLTDISVEKWMTGRSHWSECLGTEPLDRKTNNCKSPEGRISLVSTWDRRIASMAATYEWRGEVWNEGKSEGP